MSMSNSQEVLTSTSGAKRSRVRIVILLLLSVGTMINYLDRTIPGIVAPQLSKEIHIDPAMMGIIFSAFAGLMRWRRSPAGCFRPLWQQSDLCPVNFLLVAVYPAAKFHPRPKIPAASAPGTRRQRSALLSGQQPHRQHRFPQHERARATATYTVGEYIGLAAFSPLLF